MKPIRMVDLQSQYLKIKSEIDTAIENVINSTAFIKGPEVKQFEDSLAKFLHVKHVISCANGTDALQVALMALDLKPGDEVITPDFTFIATLEVVALLGLTPVIADVDKDTFLIDINSLERKITKKTKAIIPVHLFGQCCNMDEIMELAQKHNLFIVEDAAQSLGSEYISHHGKQMSGTIGNIGCTSFFPSKNLGCFGDGGALFTHNDTIAAKLRSIVNHGMQVRYHHDMVGVNSRLDTLQAAILNVKLNYLSQYNAARQSAAMYYDNELGKLSGIQIPSRSNKSTHIFHQYTLRIKNGKRDDLKKYLEQAGIPVMVYYPIPLHLQKAFSHVGFNAADFPISEKLSNEVLSLPMHTELDEEQQSFITDSIKKFYNE